MKQLNIPKEFEQNLHEIKKYEDPYHAKGCTYTFTFLNGFGVFLDNTHYHYNRFRNLWSLTIFKNGQLYPCKLNKGDIMFDLTDKEVYEIMKKVKEGKLNE